MDWACVAVGANVNAPVNSSVHRILVWSFFTIEVAPSARPLVSASAKAPAWLAVARSAKAAGAGSTEIA
jgi:hypothetical protein